VRFSERWEAVIDRNVLSYRALQYVREALNRSGIQSVSEFEATGGNPEAVSTVDVDMADVLAEDIGVTTLSRVSKKVRSRSLTATTATNADKVTANSGYSSGSSRSHDEVADVLQLVSEKAQLQNEGSVPVPLKKLRKPSISEMSVDIKRGIALLTVQSLRDWESQVQ
jgi:hypothetical protein